MSYLTPTAQNIAEKRYFQKDENGIPTENWEGLCKRVVDHVCANETKEYKDQIFDLILHTKFIPNSPCLVNAGNSISGLLACHVSPAPEDTWNSMCENIKRFGDVARRGGGNGVCFSKIRPEGDPVFGSTHAKACGPIEHMRMVSEVMSSITQAGFRGMAMMATLHVNHPDIVNFIKSKQRERALKSLLKEDITHQYEELLKNGELNILLDKFISNFNISVVVSDKFMKAVEEDKDWNLEFNGKTYQTVKAKDLFDLIVTNAWRNGDPGLLFDDRVNDGPYKYSGQRINATNPCFHGDSMVAVADGRNFVSIKQLAEEGKDVPVYCCDPKTGNIHIRWGRNPRKTETNAKICKVVFDDGGSILTTPEHQIMLSNGEYKPVQNLAPGNSVKMMKKFEYVSHKQKYYGIVRGDDLSTKPEHRMIYEFFNEPVEEDSVIHHKDFDGQNNLPSNLEKMSFSDHSSYHRKFNNPMTHWYPNATPEEKQRYHDNMSASITGELNGMYGKKHSVFSKKKIGQKTIERMKDPEYIVNLSESVKKSYTKKRKKEISKQKKEHWNAGLYDSLKAEIVKTKCEWCGKEFEKKSFSKVKYCSLQCGNQIDITDDDILDNAIQFVNKHGVYPTVSTWENYTNSIVSRETIRKRFKNFQGLSERLIQNGVFAGLSPNCNLTPDIIAGAIVHFTVKNGRQPTAKDMKNLCSYQSMIRHGGYDKLVSLANKMCAKHSVNHKVLSVEILEDAADVYNITVDEYHNLCILSSVETKQNRVKGKKFDVSRYSTVVYKNCGEQPLPEWGSCNLGSIDVSKFYSDELKDVDWGSLKSAIHTAVQFLDDVIDVNKFPSKEFETWAKDNRPVGLGIMGWADLLLKKRIAYGSPRSIEFAEELAKFFEKEAHKKSVQLGKERGTPKCCDYKELDYRRNVTTVSIAPTGSISLLAGCNGSIEPFYSPTIWIYNNTGSYQIKHEVADKAYFRSAVNDDESKQVTWQQHIDMQAAFQKFCDSGISKCITGNSLVITKEGLTRISDLNDNRIEDSFSDLGIKVQSERDFRDATEFYYGGLRSTIRLETQNGLVIEGTPNHKIKIMLSDGSVNFVRLDEIKIGDYSPIQFNTKIFGNVTVLPPFDVKSYGNSKSIRIPENLNENVSYLIGLITAEGNYQADNSVVITHSNTTILEEANDLFEKEFGVSGTVVLDNRTESVYKLQVNSRNLVRWMQDIAQIKRGACNKIIPNIILKTTPKNIWAFLSGLFFDGYVSVSNKGVKLAICLGSEPIIRDLQILLMNFGVMSNIVKKKNKKYNKYFHELLIYGSSLQTMKDNLVFKETWKHKALSEFVCNKPNEYHLGYPLHATNIVANVISQSNRSMYEYIKEFGKHRVKSAVMRNSEMKREDIEEVIKFFYDETSFMSSVTNLCKSIKNFNNCIFQKIVKISNSQSEVFDIHVPSNNTFYANGFINHNTVNMPNHATIDEIYKAYFRAYKANCKGITIYRDGSKTTQVLNTKAKGAVGSNVPNARPKDVPCDIFKARADGFDWHVIVGKVDDTPYEVFAVNGRVELPETGFVTKKKKRHYSLSDPDGNILIDNLIEEEQRIHPKVSLETRRFSLELRHGIHPKYIVDQIDKSHDVITSFSKACGRIMKNKYIDSIVAIDELCPNCIKDGKQVKIINESGCIKCSENCGFSKCG